MMSRIRNSETGKNLLRSFAGESQARNRYTFFASQAKKEGFMQIGAIFEETANQEKEHAERFFKFLEGGTLEITGTFPAGIIDNTAMNLISAAVGEYNEWHDLYPAYAAVARSEGFNAAADVWDAICVSEKFHEKRFRSLLEHVEEKTVFSRSKAIAWRCRNCGYIYFGTSAPGICPACAHVRGYFEVLCENW